MTKLTKEIVQNAMINSMGSYEDIAQKCNVHRSTISRYLEKNPDMLDFLEQETFRMEDKIKREYQLYVVSKSEKRQDKEHKFKAVMEGIKALNRKDTPDIQINNQQSVEIRDPKIKLEIAKEMRAIKQMQMESGNEQ